MKAMTDTKTLLLVEDNAVIAMDEAETLKRYGYQVITAFTGEKAVAVAETRNIDLVLMDIELGKGIDGTETARRILQRRDIPVVFLTSHTERGMLKRTEDITSYGYVVKNSGETVLIASIKMAFRLYETHKEIDRKNREIKAANEELQATIEELQATNEEFEAANEALRQSQDELLARERALVESEARFQSLFSNMGEGVALHELVSNDAGAPVNYRLVECNPQFERILSMKRENVLGRLATEVFGTDEAPYLEEYSRIVLTGKGFRKELYFEPMDKHFEISTAPWGYRGFATIFSDISERRRMEKELFESEKKYRLIFDNSPLGVLHFDAHGVITICNDTLVKIAGSSREALEGLDITGLRDTALVAALRNALNGKPGLYEGEYHSEIAHKVTPLRGMFAPFVSVNGAVTGGIGIFEDISERIQAEAEREIALEALRKSEEKYRELVENANCIIMKWSRDGTIIFMNEFGLRFFGFTEEELLGRPVVGTIVPPHDKEGNDAETIARDFFAHPQKHEQNITKNMRKNGELVWIAWNNKPIRNDDEVVIGMFSVGGDITDRRRAELELRTKTDELAHFFKANLDLMLIADTDSTIMRLNSEWENVLRYTVAEMEGKKYIEFVHPDDLAMTIERVEELSNQKAVLNFVNRYRHADGSYRWLEWRAYPHPRGKLIYAAARDITGRIQAEQELEGALREKQALYRELQHRMKNSMAVISGLVGLEMNRSTMPETRNALEGIRNRVNSMASLYTTLSDSGGSNNVRLDDYLTLVLKNFSTAYVNNMAGISLTTRFDPVTMDARRAISVGLIVNELATNALKYAFPDGNGGIISVQCRADNGELLLKVADDGIGFPDDFDIDTSKGLGAQLVAMLTEQLNGTLAWKNDRGARIDVCVPLAE